jgi:phosphoribosylamine---glycine ligase
MALRSPISDAVYCAPGNSATAAIAPNLPVPATDADGLVRLVRERGIDLTILGPEAAVAAGVADAITAAGGSVFGPSAAAGRIESSKVFAKELMREAGVPTPSFRVFEDAASARDYVRGEGRAFVVKADGLAKGKGTLVPATVEETLEAIDTLMVARSAGAAAEKILLEEPIEGREVSLLAFVDGERVQTLVPACDYKRALDGDRGPNTGGMGGYSPVGFFGESDASAAVKTVLEPVVGRLRERGSPYRGCLYAGLMVNEGRLQVLEFNARFGDPEAQVVLPRAASDLLPLMVEAARGELSTGATWSPRCSVGVVLASKGYPGPYGTGHPIEGLSSLEPDVYAFHAGTASGPAGYETAGGRVLTLVAVDETMAAARARAYRNAQRVRFTGMIYRTDIGLREVEPATVS